MENSGACSSFCGGSSSSRKRERPDGMLTPEQVQRLVQFFEECPFPDQDQQTQLSDELGLEPDQTKFWFQNKRNQTKIKRELDEDAAPHANNRSAKCQSCRDLSLMGRGHGCHTAVLHQENAHLPLLDPSPLGNANIGNPDSPFGVRMVPGLEYFLISEIADSSLNELHKLLLMDFFWVKSEIEGQYTLHLSNYERTFPQAKYFRGNDMCKESSKAFGLVPIEGKRVVDILLDPMKRMSFFSYLISESRPVRVAARGDLHSRSGSLQLIYERMHAISPFIRPREFYILRYCQQICAGKWVIADLPYHEYSRNGVHICPAVHMRHPSGCLIQDLPNRFCKVTWVEHVLVDPKSEVPQLYSDVISSGLAFGAQRWISTLQRMIGRNFKLVRSLRNPDFKLEIEAPWAQSTNERKKIMWQCARMVKSFCSRLSMFGTSNFPLHTVVNNDSLRIVVGKNVAPGEPPGYVISAATCLWLPILPNVVFDFLCDAEKRTTWDSLCCYGGARVISKIPTGSYQGNSISVMTYMPDTNNLIIQESNTDALGALIAYSTYSPVMGMVPYRYQPSGLAWLPSGFTIYTNPNRPSTSSSSGSRSGGCILTALFNFNYLGTDIFLGNPISHGHLTTVREMLLLTVEKIRHELLCSHHLAGWRGDLF